MQTILSYLHLLNMVSIKAYFNDIFLCKLSGEEKRMIPKEGY